MQRVTRRFRRSAATVAVVASIVSVVGAPPHRLAAAKPATAADRSMGYEWRPVRIGGGGNISGIDAADDGTLVARSDVYGAYILEPKATMWRQLVTTASMPPEWRLPKMGKGVQEVAIAPSDSTRIYLMWAGHLFASRDRGQSFTQTAFAPASWDANGPFGRGFGDKMAVDPHDPATVYAAGPDTVLRVTHDGGQTWADTQVPAGAVDAPTSADFGGEIRSVGITGIAVDRRSPLVAGRSSVVYAASWGRGVYRSTDGGVTFEAVGGPEAVEHAAIDGQGAYWALSGDRDGPFTLWRFESGAWTEVTPAGWAPGRVADVENPFLAIGRGRTEQVVIGYGGQMFRSLDRGATWSALHWSDGRGDVTWADAPKGRNDYYLVASDALFDPSRADRLWLATGSGTQWADTRPVSSSLVWMEKTKGMETMVATSVVSTTGGPPVFGVFDFGQFGGSKNLDGNVLRKGPVPFFSGTTALDASPFARGFAVSVTTDYVQHGRYPVSSGYTTNGGASWKVFPSLPRGATSAEQFGYGTIAVSTPDNIVWAPGRYYPTATDDFQPYYTLDRGRTWAPVKLPGVDSYPADSIGGFMFGRNRQTLTADRVERGTFYLYMPGQGVFRSTDRAITWERVHEGDIGRGDATTAGTLAAVPGARGELFYTDGTVGGHDFQGAQAYGGWPLMRSRDGGATWNEVPGVSKVLAFGFGAAQRKGGPATIYLAGTVGETYGIWRSTDDGATWTMIGDYPYVLDWVTSISGDMNTFGTVYVGFAGSSFVYGKPSRATAPGPTYAAP